MKNAHFLTKTNKERNKSFKTFHCTAQVSLKDTIFFDSWFVEV